MIFLIILAAVVVTLFLIAMIRLRIVVTWRGEFFVKLKVLCFRYTITPRKKKSKSVKKKKRKRKKKAVESEKEQPEHTPPEKKTPGDVLELIGGIRELVSGILSKFFGYVKTEVRLFKLKFHAKDAATTALMYGVVAQSVAYLFEFLDQRSGLRVRGKNRVQITPDFAPDEDKFGFDAEIEMIFSLRMWQTVGLAMSAIRGFLRFRKKRK